MGRNKVDTKGERMRTIEIHLPWPPTVNNYYGTLIRGKRKIPYIKAQGKQFRKDVEEAIHQQLPGFDTLDDSLYVEVVLYPPDARRRDLDNYMKALLDAITLSNIWEDDSQIDQLSIFRGVKMPKGMVTVKIDLGGPVMPAP